MFFYVEFTEENVMKYKKAVEDYGVVEICYNTYPRQQVLVAKRKIRECPHLYCLHPVNIPIP
ncbi:hypothetical protein J3Q64DRAFT_1644386 [Phycomyces blakesleeanus]|uniref:Uncharacterized protein n=1 Tax=Phycomyces blakesleeanus TaxID=4837 RepID=A0ABR3AQW0_PHYBL